VFGGEGEGAAMWLSGDAAMFYYPQNQQDGAEWGAMNLGAIEKSVAVWGKKPAMQARLRPVIC
jgi:hypothetical protein